MKLLLLGSGGREHALAWKIAQSPKIEKQYIAPGNAGTSEVGENVILNLNDFAEIGDFVKSKAIDMLVVGPEAPLVKGIVDYFRQDEDLKKVKVIGPSQAGAQLEGSKDFAKRFMRRHNIPTAADIRRHKRGRRHCIPRNAATALRAQSRRAGRRKRRTYHIRP